jgi:hypothetical protein
MNEAEHYLHGYAETIEPPKRMILAFRKGPQLRIMKKLRLRLFKPLLIYVVHLTAKALTWSPNWTQWNLVASIIGCVQFVLSKMTKCLSALILRPWISLHILV